MGTIQNQRRGGEVKGAVAPEGVREEWEDDDELLVTGWRYRGGTFKVVGKGRKEWKSPN